MSTSRWQRMGIGFTLMAGLVVFSIGCNQTTGKGHAKGKGKGGKANSAEVADTKHDAWWCDEHGVPEEICGQCSQKAAAEAKKKGDWCKEHDRPDSQCFICHPKLKEKFAAEYRAKYGKEPPPMEEPAAEKKETKKS